MKVNSALITSYHSSLNSGDRALLEMNIRHLKEAFDSPQILVAVNWPEETYFQHPATFNVVRSAWHAIGIRQERSFWHQLLHTALGMRFAHLYRRGLKRGIPQDWREVFNAYEKADVIASVSSTLFYSTGRYGWPFPVKTWSVGLAHFFSKPFMVMPQSIGPLRWNWEKQLLHNAYQQAFLILLRDAESLRLAKSIGLPDEKVHFSPDPTFEYEPALPSEAMSVLSRYGYSDKDISIGLTLIPWQGRWVNQEVMDHYYQALSGFLTEFCSQRNRKVFLFNQVTGPTPLDDDRVAASQLIQKMASPSDQIVHVNEVLSPALLKACYGRMKLVIATRMHSGIFSLGMGVPVLYIGYLQKTRGLMEWMGLSNWVLELDQVTQSNISEYVYKALQENEERRLIIAQKLPAIKAEIANTPLLIRQSFEKI
jgi:colanic acid/amylovoran biosynthesis protein